MKNCVTFCLLELVFSTVTLALHGLLALDAPLHSAQSEDKEAGIFPWWDEAMEEKDGKVRRPGRTEGADWVGAYYSRNQDLSVPELGRSPALPSPNDVIKDAHPFSSSSSLPQRTNRPPRTWALGTRRNSWHQWCSQSPETLVLAIGYTLPLLPENIPRGGVAPLSALRIRRSSASSTCICFTGRVLSNTGTDGRSSGKEAWLPNAAPSPLSRTYEMCLWVVLDSVFP